MKTGKTQGPYVTNQKEENAINKPNKKGKTLKQKQTKSRLDSIITRIKANNDYCVLNMKTNERHEKENT